MAGIAVSILELACTGQVYAPTIMVMMKNTETRSGAMIYLLLYNLAFIIPLAITSGFAYFGTENQKFSAFLQRHAAIVKLLTGLLFLIFFAISMLNIHL